MAHEISARPSRDFSKARRNRRRCWRIFWRLAEIGEAVAEFFRGSPKSARRFRIFGAACEDRRGHFRAAERAADLGGRAGHPCPTPRLPATRPGRAVEAHSTAQPSAGRDWAFADAGAELELGDPRGDRRDGEAMEGKGAWGGEHPLPFHLYHPKTAIRMAVEATAAPAVASSQRLMEAGTLSWWRPWAVDQVRVVMVAKVVSE